MADRIPDRSGLDDLAAELRALGGWIDMPEPPDVRAAVRARLASDSAAVPAKRPVVSRRWLLAAAALLIALVIAVVPQGRAAVAHAVTGLLRFAGVEVRQGQPAPRPTPEPLPSQRSASLDEARRLATFPIGVPAALGAPERVLLSDPAPGTSTPRVVSLLYRNGTVRLDEFDGSLDLGFAKTTATADTEWVDVNGASGLWFPTPHEVVYVDRNNVRHRETARLTGPTLVWSDAHATYRLEGLPLNDAVEAARSLG